MTRSVIKIKRRDLMTAEQVAAQLRAWADQLDEAHTVTLDRLPITLANQVLVRQEYKKDGCEHELSLKVSWVEKFSDAVKVSDESQEEDSQEGMEETDDSEVPPPPLDLPGPGEDTIRLRD